MEISGSGKSINKNAIVENEEPVGVKVTLFAKLIGKKTLKKDSKLTTATRNALAYSTYKKVLSCAIVFRCETVTKYNNI